MKLHIIASQFSRRILMIALYRKNAHNINRGHSFYIECN